MINFIECENLKEAREAYPSACKIQKVCGGYMVFEFVSDYEIWKNQK